MPTPPSEELELHDTQRMSNTELLSQAARAIQSVVTAPTVSTRVNRTLESYAPLADKLPFEILGHIELLARYNPDYSQAVANIRTLANSGHELFVGGSDLAKRKAKEHLEELARTVNPSHGGIDGLIDKLLWQAATFGAMCGEWVISEDMTRVIDFADISPRSIRFFWDVDEFYNGWAPYQMVSAELAKKAQDRGQKVRQQRYVQLNPITFHYYAFDPAPNSPYGVPPFIAALRNIGIQDNMMENLEQITRKMGLLSIVDMTIKSLQKRRDESDSEFVTRSVKFLEEYARAAEQMVLDGGLVHFDDVEVATQNITGNAAGATNIFKQNEEQVFSGLKSMPSVQGRSYSTTETYAGVAYDIMIRNTASYQKACKRMIESGYWLAINLANIRADEVKLRFNPNKTLHRLQTAQAEVLEVKVALMKWAMGIWDQQDVAQHLGEQDIKKEYEDIPESSILGNASPGGGGGATSNGQEPGMPPPARSDSEILFEYLSRMQ